MGLPPRASQLLNDRSEPGPPTFVGLKIPGLLCPVSHKMGGSVGDAGRSWHPASAYLTHAQGMVVISEQELSPRAVT